MLVIALITGFAFWSCNPNISQKQQELADSWGVNIDDYPAPGVFPLGYLESKLKPGATTSDVHAAIQGYVKALKCDQYSTKREIYYFFSYYDRVAVRIEAWYDESGKLIELNSEDQNSRSIQSERCSPGWLPESQ